MACLSASCEEGPSEEIVVRFHGISSGAEISRRVSLVKEYLRNVRTGEELCMTIDAPGFPEICCPIPHNGIEPFGAFGSGLHATTSSCLELIGVIAEKLADRTGTAVLDIGTGTGILSLEAYRVGMGRITAIDVCVRAVISAFHNFNLHGIARQVELRLGDIRLVGHGYGLVLANLRLGVLSGMFEEILHRVTPGGVVIASGIRCEEVAEFERIVSGHEKLTIVHIVERNGWYSCALCKEGKQ